MTGTHEDLRLRLTINHGDTSGAGEGCEVSGHYHHVFANRQQAGGGKGGRSDGVCRFGDQRFRRWQLKVGVAGDHVD